MPTQSMPDDCAKEVADSSIVDVNLLSAWMDEQGLEAGDVERMQPISGGTQNVLLRFERGGRSFVLRRGPLHLRPRSNDALRREIRVLQALSLTNVPHPGLIAACPDETVLKGSVFYLMEPVVGFNATVEVPKLHAAARDLQHRMGLEIVDALATLGAVDHVAVGLEDLGRAEGFLERQVPRWLAELDTYSRVENYPGPAIPGVQRVADWLERNRPRVWTPGIMHGDYHLANVLFQYQGPRVAAIVDWEMCTIGDPLLDLGWLLATWHMPEAPISDAFTPTDLAGGLPAPAELVTRYAENSTRDLSAITWYTVLACFKLGIVLEGSHARASAGKASSTVGDRLHAITLKLFSRAQRLIA